jgi:hypothetical protein
MSQRLECAAAVFLIPQGSQQQHSMIFYKMAASEAQTLLDYESAMFLELTEEDGLFVTARSVCVHIVSISVIFVSIYVNVLWLFLGGSVSTRW